MGAEFVGLFRGRLGNRLNMTLGATTMIRDGIKYDYHFEETIRCLQDLADQVVVCVVKTDDGTLEAVRKIADAKTKVIVVDNELWQATSGKERLSYFSNIAIANLDTEWNIYVQGDECIHESSFPLIRQAIETNNEAFLIHRLNLWNTPYQYLTCPLERQPCSTAVIRLAKTKYRCVGDGESLDVFAAPLLDVKCFHLGFVRKRDVMKAKVINIQENIFQTPHDSRLDEDPEFNPMRYFSKDDLSPIPMSLPKYVEEWAKERLY